MSNAVSSLPLRAVERLDSMASELSRLERQLEDPAVLTDHRKVRDLSIQKAALEPVVGAFRDYRRASAEAATLRRATEAGQDPDFAALAREELPTVERRAAELLEQVKARLVTTEDRRIGSVIFEIRAGTGGDEAALWARDLLDIYQKYAAARKWQFELLDLVPETDAGGIRSAVASVKG